MSTYFISTGLLIRLSASINSSNELHLKDPLFYKLFIFKQLQIQEKLQSNVQGSFMLPSPCLHWGQHQTHRQDNTATKNAHWTTRDCLDFMSCLCMGACSMLLVLTTTTTIPQDIHSHSAFPTGLPPVSPSNHTHPVSHSLTRQLVIWSSSL